MTLLLGDSLERLRELPANSVEACVCDPPYGLSAAKNSGKRSRGGFMGKRWDYDVPSVELWREVYRVMKPGAHLLSFGGTRTYHRMVVAIEDAGFEIRDQVMWIYGSGFPKSLDVSKAIDKAAGAEREVIREIKGHKPGDHGGSGQYGHGEDRSITVPATPEAKQWSGWGTALKPANEPIVLARKPLERGLTVAANCLKWGTGALNVDASRIATSDNLNGGAYASETTKAQGSSYTLGVTGKTFVQPQGRWPSNVLLDEDAAAVLDEQSGVLRARGNKTAKPGRGEYNASSYEFGQLERGFAGDSGGASRFFYVAKASRRERNAGLEGMERKPNAKSQELSPGASHRQANAQERAQGLTHVERQATANHHPTVKPVRLMEYLVRMITPAGGVCLDPFMGSGTTGVACARLGFAFVGVERESEYLEIARRRIEHASRDARADQASGGKGEGDDAA